MRIDEAFLYVLICIDRQGISLVANKASALLASSRCHFLPRNQVRHEPDSVGLFFSV
jgi:hypothetical protein